MKLGSIADAAINGKQGVPPWLTHDAVNWRFWREAASDCPRIDISEVARYFFEDSGQEDWPVSSFVSMAPPFRRFWVEYVTPLFSNSEGKFVDGSRAKELFPRMGALVTAFDLKAAADVDGVRSLASNILLRGRSSFESLSAERVFELAIKGEARWLVVAHALRLSAPDAFCVTGFEEITAVRDDGTPIDSTTILSNTSHIQHMPEQADSLCASLKPIYFAISLMQCKNVSFEEAPTSKPNNPYTRKGREPRLSFKTLAIEPMRRTLNNEGGAHETGLKNALHICRGHFKDYRQSGLFGKIKGVFWWDSSVKGSASQGVVAKDYTVKAPPTPEGNA